jgi:homoserine acetyltransferase
MQAIGWGSVAYFGFANRIVAIVATGYSTSMHIAFDAIGRAVIGVDPVWKNGSYLAEEKPDSGLAFAMMMVPITYLSEQSMHINSGRRLQKKASTATDLKLNSASKTTSTIREAPLCRGLIQAPTSTLPKPSITMISSRTALLRKDSKERTQNF